MLLLNSGLKCRDMNSRGDVYAFYIPVGTALYLSTSESIPWDWAEL